MCITLPACHLDSDYVQSSSQLDLTGRTALNAILFFHLFCARSRTRLPSLPAERMRETCRKSLSETRLSEQVENRQRIRHAFLGQRQCFLSPFERRQQASKNLIYEYHDHGTGFSLGPTAVPNTFHRDLGGDEHRNKTACTHKANVGHCVSACV